ncbi:MAG: ATP-binding cassette domain-containing protein [Phycisphaerales bacterium]|nr:ATP-binding cassette domain-containing protein [Phycisphaerales bacterium]
MPPSPRSKPAPAAGRSGSSPAPSAVRPTAAGSAATPTSGSVRWLTIRGARQNNLRNIDVGFPLGRFTCVTGVSGSGKSSLVNEILYKVLARELNAATSLEPGLHTAVEGKDALDKVIAIDQTPIGRTPRSNPATYIKVFDEIRALFTKLPDAKLRGYKPGRFSFNVPAARGGGRCEACEGNGANRIEMDFLADVWVTCPVCEGQRFNHATLQVRHKGKSIADVLHMEVAEALAHFENVPRIRGMLQTLHDVGLDYLQLGQASTTLSGGEAQRIKLARELVKKPTGGTLYVLDEPTTGLHFADIRRLLAVLHGFVDAGNTVVVIEHNLDVVKTADWVIDLGPEGGEGGGHIVITGTPEDVAHCAASDTGRALRSVLWPDRYPPESTSAPDSAAAPRSPAPPAHTAVTVVGARQHNLRDLSVSFPRERLTVCTGVSGSGKTSFAIDTVFTEGYRRYVESLSAYARQFLGQLAKPRVEHVEGLSPAICIEQRSAGKSPRSTVGTVTEIYDYMRVLWARAGRRYCPKCAVPIGTQTADEIVERVLQFGERTPIIILAAVQLGDGETYAGLFQRLKASGYTRVRIDGEIVLTAQATTLDARRKHRVEIVVDRTVVRQAGRSRLAESIEHALALGNGLLTLLVEAVETHEPHDDTAPDTETVPGDGTAAPVAYRVQQTPAREFLFSQRLVCTRCGTSYEEIGPNHYSFNSQLGWCETCEGLGVQRGAPAAAIIPHPERSLFDGAVAGWSKIGPGTPLGRLLVALCGTLGVPPQTPLSEWTPAQKRALLFGTAGSGGGARGWIDADGDGLRFRWNGFFPTIDAATRNSWSFRFKLRNIVTEIPCVTCHGGRLRPESAATRLGHAGTGRTIVEICDLPLNAVASFFRDLDLTREERQIAGELLKEIHDRLHFLIDVGLDYLTLHRAAPTLSGGEAQRIRLASQIGSGLSGVLYVLDEPTIGLHPRDTGRLVRALLRLRDLGNTLLLVEHDRDVIASADRLLDFGPRAGSFGGRIVAQGTPAELARPPSPGTGVEPEGEELSSLTRAYLNGEAAIAIPTNRRPVPATGAPEVRPAAAPGARRPQRPRGSQTARRPVRAALRRPLPQPLDPAEPAGWLVVRGARQHNLANITMEIPLGRFVCVTGVSGSGKSSLVNDILWPALANRLQRAGLTVGEHDELLGSEHLDKVINVDQLPIGSTPSSNPATYTGVFDWIRELFARLPDSKVRGYTANRFSFNRPGGRCEACQGYGQRCIEMHFMPDVWVECETCRGRRYNPETLEVRYKGRTIADVLELRVAEALEMFANVPRIRRMLQTLADVGLDYVQLGQSATTLSGGEAQRVKLATELGKPDTGRTLYILDEPTTGLHFDDVRKLLTVMQRLVDLGNSVLVVEHNLDVLKCADWIIDLGPEAGIGGGRLVAAGPPETLIASTTSHTAAALAPVLAAGPHAEREVYDPATHAAETLAAERAGLGRIGTEVRMPWQVDGRKWHLEQRSSRSERPRRWEPSALALVIELVEREGRRLRRPGTASIFTETHWGERASVEVTAVEAPVWFLHALTGGEWLVELYFRSAPGVFHAATLNAELGLKTLDERTDLETYGDWPRVDVRPRRDGYDAVVVYVHDRKEIDTPAFRRFIRTAVQAYADLLTASGV